MHDKELDNVFYNDKHYRGVILMDFIRKLGSLLSGQRLTPALAYSPMSSKGKISADRTFMLSGSLSPVGGSDEPHIKIDLVKPGDYFSSTKEFGLVQLPGLNIDRPGISVSVSGRNFLFFQTGNSYDVSAETLKSARNLMPKMIESLSKELQPANDIIFLLSSKFRHGYLTPKNRVIGFTVSESSAGNNIALYEIQVPSIYHVFADRSSQINDRFVRDIVRGLWSHWPNCVIPFLPKESRPKFF